MWISPSVSPRKEQQNESIHVSETVPGKRGSPADQVVAKPRRYPQKRSI